MKESHRVWHKVRPLLPSAHLRIAQAYRVQFSAFHERNLEYTAMHQQQYLVRPANTQENINIQLFMKIWTGGEGNSARQVTNRRHQTNGRGEAYCSPCSLRAVLPEGIHGWN